MKITWNGDAVSLPSFDRESVSLWLAGVAASHGCAIGRINYIFMDDEAILALNRSALGHDYYTDVITFDYSALPTVNGDIYISLDTVASNAALVGAPEMTELMRVIVHGLLHLCGINDKGPGEREIMERHENEALSICNSI